ncbi:PLAC8 family-domain-containing protein [Lactifluus volemus]|nr:PLAC8 family-domain-containing protein [Lactifluus volemus]
MPDPKELSNVQPQAIGQMNMGGNKNALNREIGEDGKRAWSYGLLDCFNYNARGLCCLAVWCPCVVFSKTKQRLDSLHYQGTPLQDSGETFTVGCYFYGLLCPCCQGWGLQVDNRTTIRDRYGIRGNYLSDFFTSWFCSPCALTQERREIELEEASLP